MTLILARYIILLGDHPLNIQPIFLGLCHFQRREAAMTHSIPIITIVILTIHSPPT